MNTGTQEKGMFLLVFAAGFISPHHKTHNLEHQQHKTNNKRIARERTNKSTNNIKQHCSNTIQSKDAHQTIHFFASNAKSQRRGAATWLELWQRPE
jgi:hypothetical protein